ncbi:MAG: YybH family protein [Chloroflexota bacterium]
MTQTGVRAALDAFDRYFVASDADGLTGMFEDDGQLLLQEREALRGHAAIRAHWLQFFGAYDASSWRATIEQLDVHGDDAYSLSTYTETLVHRQGDPSRIVSGRLICFLRRDAADAWRIRLLMNAHVRPVEEVPATGV